MLNAPLEGAPRHLTDEERFCLEGCRTYKQYYGMRSGFERGDCAFCKLNPQLNKVVWRDEDDLVRVWHVHEDFMRAELSLHILIVPSRHVRFMADLTPEEWQALGRATSFAKDHFDYTGGLFHAREGDMRKTAGTVPHLHINIFEPNQTEEVRVPVYKDPADRAENQARAERFSALYEEGVTPEDFDRLVKERQITKEGLDFPPGE